MPKGRRDSIAISFRQGHDGALGTSAAAAVGLSERLRPWLLGALVAIFVSRPLFPSEAPPEAGDNLPTIMLCLVLVAIWFLGTILAGEFRLRFGAVDAAVLLLVGWHTIAGLWAAMHGSPRAAVNTLWLWVAYGASFLLARQLIAGRREARAVVVVMIGLAVGLAAFGLDQYFVEMPQTRNDYLKDPDAALRAAGLWYPKDSPQRETFQKRLFAMEPPATFALTNSLAGFLVPWLAITAGIAVCGWRSPYRWRLVAAALCFAVVLAACLLLTKSRSGYLAALVGLPLAWWSCRRGNWRLNWKLIGVVTAGVAVLVVLATVTGGLDKQVASEATKSLGYRIQYWQATLKLIADYPVFGCGPGQFQESYTAYKLPESSEEIADPHNFLLEMGATAGIPSLLALAAALGLFAWTVLSGASGLPGIGETSKAGATPAVVPKGAPFSDESSEVAWAGDATAFILGGGVIGFLLAIPLGLMGSAPPAAASLWLGLPLAVIVMAGLWPWIREGTMPALLPSVGVAVLLINLLAAGALSFAGLAGTLWLLMALGLNLSDAAPARRFTSALRWVALGVSLVACLACYQTAYAPVLQRESIMRRVSGPDAHALELLETAAAADPLAAKPRIQLAATAFAQWQQQPTPEALRQFQRYQEAVFPLTPYSNADRADAGDRYWTVYQYTKDKEILRKAVEAFQEAVSRYPTSAKRRADLALALDAAGERAAARHEAQEAKRLHELTPHEDKKLPIQVLDELNKGPLRNTSG